MKRLIKILFILGICVFVVPIAGFYLVNMDLPALSASYKAVVVQKYEKSWSKGILVYQEKDTIDSIEDGHIGFDSNSLWHNVEIGDTIIKAAWEWEVTLKNKNKCIKLDLPTTAG